MHSTRLFKKGCLWCVVRIMTKRNYELSKLKEGWMFWVWKEGIWPMEEFLTSNKVLLSNIYIATTRRVAS